MKPNWGLLALLVPLTVGLLVLQDDIPLPYQGHQFLEFGVVGLAFGLLFLWVHANLAALSQEQTTHPDNAPYAEQTPGAPTTVRRVSAHRGG